MHQIEYESGAHSASLFSFGAEETSNDLYERIDCTDVLVFAV